jgi:DMSO/TMAO reductase YedYZ molybdopterin-dependent catalytic subunit
MRDRKPGKPGSGVWSAIGSWTGTPLRDFLKLVGADTRAKYVWFQCADKDGYNSPLDMATALHP